MWGDLRTALRTLRAAPMYAAAGTLTLALAIAANTAIFGVVHGVLLKPLPIHDPARVALVWESDPSKTQPVIELTYRQFERWSASARSFERLAAMSSSSWSMVLEGLGDPLRLPVVTVSASFFDTLGTRAAMGRVLTRDDDKQGGVVVMSHGLWVERFSGDSTIIGKSLTLDGRPHTVVGVMPRGFDFPRGTALWMPVAPVLRALSSEWKADVPAIVRVLYMIGRLRPGVDVAAASEELSSLEAGAQELRSRPPRAVVTPLLDYTLGPLREGLWWLLGAVGVLLVVACANISGLTLTRAAVRRREHGIRLALGATRFQLARLWLAEAAILGVAGGTIGLTAARWLLGAMIALAPEDIPRIADLTVDLPVAFFTLGVTALAAILCAAAVVLQGTTAKSGAVLNEAAHATPGQSSTRIRSTLVVAQIALAVVLLVSSGLVVRSFSALRRLDVGFDPANVLTLAVEPSAAPLPAQRWFEEVIDRIESLPEVESAGAVSLRPLAHGAIGTDTSVILEGQPDPDTSPAAAREAQRRNPTLNLQIATPGYFRAMRIPLRRGRLFDGRDQAGTPRVVVIGERTAARLWPGQDPIGKRLNTPQHARGVVGSAWHTVVGVVKDVHYRGINDVRLDLYEPAAQSLAGLQFLTVRATGDPLRIAAAVQAQIRSHDRRSVMSGIATMDAILSRALAPWRLSSWMLTLFAAMAFALAVVGLVGLIGLEVAQRLREFAVRVALGAEARHVRSQVYRAAATHGAVGLSLGIAAALGATQWMRTLLFGVSPADAPTYAIVSVFVGVTVLAVSLVPAARAARVDPIEILKRE
jgi:putative ABC transport system permease protein